MADASKLLRALLGGAYKMPKTEIDKLLADDTTDEDGESQLLESDKARIGKLTTPAKGSTFQDGYAKGKKEVLTALETELKEKFEFESDATGVELVEAIVTEKGKAAGKPKELTDDDVRKHPLYQSLEKANKTALKAKDTEWQAKLDETTATYKKGETFSTVSQYALTKLAKLNPVIPTNAAIAANLQRSFLDSLKQYDYEVQDNGNRIVMLKDGKVVDDGHGHSLEFDTFLQSQAAGYYEMKANNGGSNGGNGDPKKDNAGGAGGSGGGAPAYPAGIVKPKTWEEVMVIVNNIEIPANDRATVMNVWEQESKTGN